MRGGCKPLPAAGQWRAVASTVCLAAGAVCWLLFAMHAGLGLGGSAGDALAAPWLYDAAEACAMAACAWRALVIREARAAWACMALAIGCWVAADAYWYAFIAPLPVTPYPTWADAVYLLFFPAILCGIAGVVRARTQRLPAASWLEGLTAGCTLGALAAGLLLDEVLRFNGTDLATAATTLAYPVGDVMLLAVVVGAWMAQPGAAGRGWRLIATGLLMITVADALYLLQVAAGSYAEGGTLDILWPAAVLLIAAAAREDARPVTVTAPQVWRSQLLTCVFAFIALGLLVLDALSPLNWAAEALLIAALTASTLRLMLAARENALLASSSTLAYTDELSGSPTAGAST